MHGRLALFTASEKNIGKLHAYVYGFECNDSSADSDNLKISAACNAIYFFYPACGRSLHPSNSKLSCSVCTDPGSPPCQPNVKCKSCRPTVLC